MRASATRQAAVRTTNGGPVPDVAATGVRVRRVNCVSRAGRSGDSVPGGTRSRDVRDLLRDAEFGIRRRFIDSWYPCGTTSLSLLTSVERLLGVPSGNP
jgi:hypothetical protein